MRLLERLIVAMSPGRRTDWVLALLAEQEAIDGRFKRISWLAGLIALISWAHVDLIRSRPTSLLGGIYMKTALWTLSIMGAITGCFLIGLYIVIDGSPIIPLLLGLGMLAQSGYTLLYLAERFRRLEHLARQLLLAGQIVALALSSLGGLIAIVSNINPPGGDYEYGPMTMFVLIFLQAIAALFLAAFSDPERSEIY